MPLLLTSVRAELVLERGDKAIVGRVEGVVFFPPGEVDHSLAGQFERRDLVRDRFLRSGHGLADGDPHALEYALRGLGLRGDVLVYGLEVGLGHVMTP